MANSARARSTCAAGGLRERLRGGSSWRSSAVSGGRGSFRGGGMGHLEARGSPHHYTSSHGRRPTRAAPERVETALMLGALAGQGGGRCPQLCLSICAVALSALSCQARPATKPPSALG